jgi:peptidyl-prolyl cis-trans isomerase D
MISWIQTTFQRHTKLLMFFLLVAVTIPFVFTIGAAPGIGRAGPKTLEQDFFGYNLGSEQEARRIFRDGNLSAQLKGAFQVSGAQLQQYSLGRIAGLALADELGIPSPTPKQLSDHIAALPVFQNEQGAFDAARYKAFEDSLRAGGEISAADVTRADTSWTIAVGSLDYATFDPGVTVTDAALQKFHDDNSFRYEVPARPRLSVIEFKASEFLPPVAPTEAEARAYYNANAARFPAPADAKADGAAPALSLDGTAAAPKDDFPKVRAQVEAAMKQDAARRAASQAANDFTVALFERKLAPNSADLTAFLAAMRRPAVALAPFTFDAPPADRTWLSSYSEQIGRLDANRHFSDPLPTPDGYAILLWNEALPAYKPMLSEVRDRVAADYRESEKRRRFVEHGRAVRSRLQAALAAGKSFADAAQAEKLEVKTYPAFTLRQPPQDLPFQAFSALQTLETGKVAEMAATGDKGYFVFAAEKKLPDTSSANPRFAEVREQMMRFAAQAGEAALLSSLVEAELKRSAPAAAAPAAP